MKLILRNSLLMKPVFFSLLDYTQDKYSLNSDDSYIILQIICDRDLNRNLYNKCAQCNVTDLLSKNRKGYKGEKTNTNTYIYTWIQYTPEVNIKIINDIYQTIADDLIKKLQVHSGPEEDHSILISIISIIEKDKSKRQISATVKVATSYGYFKEINHRLSPLDVVSEVLEELSDFTHLHKINTYKSLKLIQTYITHLTKDNSTTCSTIALPNFSSVLLLICMLRFIRIDDTLQPDIDRDTSQLLFKHFLDQQTIFSNFYMTQYS